MYSCDYCEKNEVDTGDSNPSIVICAECNDGQANWNCVDSGTYSCDCECCGPLPEYNF